MVTLGCARNDVDSEELAARLDAGGFQLVPDATDADVIVVNTCGFIDQAKKDSIDTLLEASDQKANGRAQAVVAVGCMAERYGDELAEALPEADAVLSFDDYPDISKRLRSILAGGHIEAHKPQDRRTLLPLAPIKRSAKRVKSTGRRRLTSGPLFSAQDCFWLRPPMRILRDSCLPRLLYLSSGRGGHRGGRMAGPRGRQRGHAGQREYLQLRKGPGG